MSFILDALRRSEEERQQGKPPTVLSVHAGASFNSSPAKNRWLWPTLGALAFIGVCMSLLILRAAPLKLVVVEPAYKAPYVQPPAVVEENKPAQMATSGVDLHASRELVNRDQLPEDVQRTLPPLNISFHAYAYDPPKRGVIINDKRLKEGELIAPGVILEQITETGVIISTHGYRFRMAVVEQW